MSHQKTVLHQIADDLDAMIMKYDARLLGSAMLLRAAQVLRGAHSTGLWKLGDVRAVVEGALEDVFKPLPFAEQPAVRIAGDDEGHIGTLQ